MQNAGVALALSEKLLKDKGAWRIHGGGFGGTVQAFVPNEMVDTYICEMNKVFGEDACMVLSICEFGAIKIK